MDLVEHAEDEMISYDKKKECSIQCNAHWEYN